MPAPVSRPTEVQLTSRSAASGARTARTPSSRASVSARSAVRFQTVTSAAPASRSAHTAARALPPAPSTSARSPRGGAAKRGEQAGRVGVLRGDRPVGAEAERVGGADRHSGPAGVRGQRERGVLVRDGHVGAHEARGRAARGSSRRTARAAPAGAGSASRPSRAPRAPRCASPVSGCARPASRGRPTWASLLLQAGGRPPCLREAA